MNKLFILLAFLIVYSLFHTTDCKAQDVYTLTPTNKPQSVNRKFTYFIDETNMLTIENVLQKGNFKPSEAEVPNLNVFYGTSWSVIRFTCKEPGDYYLSLEPCAYNNVSVYQKKSNGNWTEEKQGFKVPITSSRFITNHLLFKIKVDPNDTVTLLLKVRDYMPTQLILNAGILRSFVEEFHLSDLFYCFVCGIVFTMMLYNLYLFVTQRKRVYFAYCLYSLFSLLFVVQTSGNARHLPYLLKWVYERCPSFPPAFLAIMALVFSLELFKNKLPGLFVKIIRVVIGIAIICLLLGIFGYVRESFLLLQPLAVLYVLLTFATGIIALKKRLNSAGFYMLGFGTYSVFFFFFLLSVLGVLPFNANSFKLVSTGLTIEVIILSFALGDKMKSFMLEKEKAQAESLKQSQENERLVKEQNIILEQKVNERTKQLSEANEELNQQNEEISAQRDQIEHQKELVEEQKKEMVDSITYAKRIQDAILPSQQLIREKLSDSFVLFKPKDIVAGDFYWMEQTEDRVFIAAADCTGHGVPGALVSVVCSNALNRAVKEFALTDTGKILDKVTDLVLETFEKSNEDVKDGMDISLLSIEMGDIRHEKPVVKWSGANNPLWYFNEKGLNEITADKQPIGKSDHRKPFTTHIIEYKAGTTFYLFTDGYADQFGGPKGKKFKYRPFQETILAAINSTPETQQATLDKTFESWKGKLEQVDDVCVIGIKI